jgi:hypothetical protein
VPRQGPPDNSSGSDEPKTPRTEDIFVDDSGPAKTYRCAQGTTIHGRISPAGAALVTLANDDRVLTINASAGEFAFDNVPQGVYILFAEAAGASFGSPHSVTVTADAVAGDDSCGSIELKRVELKPFDGFAFRWKRQEDLNAGIEQVTKVVDPANSSSAGSLRAAMAADPAADYVSSSESSAVGELKEKFKISLDSSELTWGAEHAERLRQTLMSIWPAWSTSFPVTKPSVWKLTEQYLPNDIQIVENDESVQVSITSEAFRFAAATPAVLDGIRGRFFSERLLLAIGRFISNNGRDRATLYQLFLEKYKVRIIDDPETAASISRETTNESAASFIAFTGEELLRIMAALAQIPGRDQWSEELWIIRRHNAAPHPIDIGPGGEKVKIHTFSGRSRLPFMEFSREAFMRTPDSTLFDPLQPNKEVLLPGTIAAYFKIVWDRILSAEMRDAWTALGEWSKVPETEFWTTRDPSQAGAMFHTGVEEAGPMGDFQTSATQYITAPEELKHRSLKRFEFLQAYVMHGVRYSRQFRGDLGFKVLNLWPDLSGPGKVIEASAIVSGAPKGTKAVTTTVKLAGSDPRLDGAQRGVLGLVNVAAGKCMSLEVYAYKPDSDYKTSLVLRSVGILSRYAPKGWYTFTSGYLYDQVGNVRYISANEMSFRIYIPDAAEAPPTPELITDSVALSLTKTAVAGLDVPVFNVDFQVRNPESLRTVSEMVSRVDAVQVGYTAKYLQRTGFDTFRTLIHASPVLPSGQYGLFRLDLVGDASININQYSVNPSPGMLKMPVVNFENPNGDTNPPEIDLNRLSVSASPTHPENPNGETAVRISIFARDDSAGMAVLDFCLRNPQDRQMCSGFVTQSSFTVMPTGTADFNEYAHTLTLPAGSLSGDWGLDFVQAFDKAGNTVQHSLSEIVKFTVENQQDR